MLGHELEKLKMKHRFTKSIIFRFITILLLLVMVPFTVLLVNASREIRSIERERAAEFLYGNLRVISSTTDNLLRSVEAGQTEMLLDAKFMRAVRNLAPYDEREEYADFKAVQTIKRILTNASVRNDVIESVYLYCAGAWRFFVSNINYNPDFNHINVQETDWYRSYEGNKNKVPWNITTTLDGGGQVLSCYRMIEEYGKPLSGLLSINVTPDVIFDITNEASLGQDNICFVIDSYENILRNPYASEETIDYIAGSVPTDTMGGTIDLSHEGERVFVSYLKSNYSGLTYVIFAPLDEIQTATERLNLLIVWFIGVSILVLLLCTVLTYRYFYHPIRDLAHAMKRVETGDFNTKMPVRRADEIGLINKQFNEMTNNINALINENYINELAKRDIQLRYTQNQINEHFLYNTLDSIHWLAKRHGAPEISSMIQALANFYRTSLASGRDVIAAGEVARMIGDYLYIQSIRLGDRLTCNSDFDASLADIEVPKDIFLPLVENAIVHGLNGQEKGTVTVTLTEEDGFMRFAVRDDGHGIPAARLAEIQSHLMSDKVSIEDSFALRTVNNQLKLYFNDTVGIHIETAIDEGTSMWFDIPFPTVTAKDKGDESDDEDDHCRR
jgi:two-component system sensor histidine kinase YesM